MKKMNRRTVLRGAGGITLGLPFLDAMSASSFSKSPVRLAYLYMPNGVGPAKSWNPKTEGKDYKLAAATSPLEPIKNLVNVHTGLNLKQMGTHHTTTGGLLSCQRPPSPKEARVQRASIDQVVAKQIGQDSFLPSLELSIEPASIKVDSSGLNETLGGYLSWSSPTTPVPREINPNSAFRRLFKDMKKGSALSSTDINKSVLDYLKDDANSLKRVLGRADKSKVDEYFYSVRQIERRVNKMSQSQKLPSGVKVPPKNIGDIRERINAMMDIIILAFQTDRTRVASFMFANDSSQRNYSFLPGVNSNHHAISHYDGNPQKLKQQIEITKYFVSCYAAMVKKMSEIPEGEGTLLDNSLVFFTSNLKEGHKHSQADMPALVAGEGGGKVKTGYHHNHKGKQYASLMLGMAKTAGCKMGSFANTNNAII
ncbi:MAG: DUF1552 domain-containing protein [Lentisphaeraceae bacterium]|nr:DUF1552 domain-containing protein [Lentisphaeraceae bacterium]